MIRQTTFLKLLALLIGTLIPFPLVAQESSSANNDRQAPAEIDSDASEQRRTQDDPERLPDSASSPTRPPRTDTSNRSRRQRLAQRRLSRTPPSLGDFFYSDALVLSGSVVEMPLAGGSRRVKISEGNMASPVDRVYFQYNHFHNAINVFDGGPGIYRNGSIDRFTFAFEKTFCRKEASIEVRLPLTNGFESGSLHFSEESVSGGQVGDLSAHLQASVVRERSGPHGPPAWA